MGIFEVGPDPIRGIAQQGHVIVRSRLQFGFTAYGDLGRVAIFQIGIKPLIRVQFRAITRQVKHLDWVFPRR